MSIPTRTTGAAALAAKAETGRSAIPPRAIHVALAAWIALMLGLAYAAPATYREFVQEDRFIEWWTVFLFLAATISMVRRALPERRIFDLLVAAFCLAVAAEECSWGQRLLGFMPPTFFLKHNAQQELTLHNFANVFGRPRGVLMLTLVGYGLLLPAFGRWRRGVWLERVRATSPPLALVPWFAVATGLLYWEPVYLTSEWVEAMAGGLFYASARPAPRRLFAGAGAAALAALAFTSISAGSLQGNPVDMACAQRETSALLADLSGGAATAKLLNAGGDVDKRVWTAIKERYLHPDRLPHFRAASCGPAPAYLIDPWGMAYWLRVSSGQNGVHEVSVYSMGPNRRRDHSESSVANGDDIIARAAFPR